MDTTIHPLPLLASTPGAAMLMDELMRQPRYRLDNGVAANLRNRCHSRIMGSSSTDASGLRGTRSHAAGAQ